MGRTYRQNSWPNFVVDHHSLVFNSGRQISWDQVPNSYVTSKTDYTITCDGGAIATATTLPVLATPVAIHPNTLLHFGGAGEMARVTAYAAAGATSLTVEALEQGIEDTDTATLTVIGKGSKQIVAGTVMAELASGKLVPRAIITGAETATCILLTNATEDSESDSLSGYGCLIGGVLYTELLPENAHGSWATWVGELNTLGVGHFIFETYADNRT